MDRVVLRALMALVGLLTLFVYLAGAVLSYAALRIVLTGPLSAKTVVAYLLVLTAVGGYLTYRFGTRQLLSEIRARPLTRATSPRLLDRVSLLSHHFGVAEPRVYVAQMATPNAFAMGSPRDSVIVVDRSLFRLLDAAEFEAILAHELAHVARYDGLVQTMAYSALRTVAGVVLLALLPVTLLISGFARSIAWVRGRPVQWTATLPGRLHRGVELLLVLVMFLLTLPLLAYSRRREFAADARAVEATGTPNALASAIWKIDRAAHRKWGFLSTLSVRGEDETAFTDLLSTHPAVEDRIGRLRTTAKAREERSGPNRKIH
ncbi:M48 family metalloprotease [Haloarculaceae archaeon H-GB1-1]|nr:M48 family metalloprotease [Haloarculaceae archaeon H-GB1-1]